MSKLVGSCVENLRAFEPDYPFERNPWDPVKHPEQHNYIASIIYAVDTDENKQPKYTDETRQEIYRLRDTGLTYREIAEIVKASKSTVCLYLQNRHKYLQIIENEVNIGKLPVNSIKIGGGFQAKRL